MEWVETTGKTVDEAKDAALDQLGVDEDEAEFEILEEPRSGLFGRTRGEARVRARVQPRQPRPKQERRDRRRSGGGGRKRGGGGGRGGQGGGRSRQEKSQQDDGDTKVSTRGGGEGASSAATGGGGNRSRRRRSGGSGGSGSGEDRQKRERQDAASPSGGSSSGKEQAMAEDVTVEEQADIMAGFLEGLLDAYGFDADINRTTIDDETIELDIQGEDLGLLIGPKGRTLSAVQELSRTVVQRQATGTHHGRVRIDVGGYRQRRKEALQRFTQQIADEVKASGERKALEAMGAADRKVVHDTVNELEGVSTISEGEEPRRRVVITPDE